MNFSVEPNPRITFGVVYEDEHLLVVGKPSRVPTQPGKGHATDTLLNGLFARYAKQLQNLGKARDFGLLHRLDRPTSGLLVVALRPVAYDQLRDDFAHRRIKKFYWAICASAPNPAEGVINLPIVEDYASDENKAGKPRLAHVSRRGSSSARDASSSGARAVRAASKSGSSPKPAITAYRTLDVSAHAALVECRPVTGRLHQVRLHLDAIGCPILGDEFYGPRRVQGASPRLALHSHRLVFKHPQTGETIDARTDWPKDLKRVLKNMGLQPTSAERRRDEKNPVAKSALNTARRSASK